MKHISSVRRALVVLALACSLMSAIAGPSCCVKAKAEGKTCEHKCCVDAHKANKTCEKCQPKPSCCDKAIASTKDCAHKCCLEAAKQKKVCTKCNPEDKPVKS